MNELNTTLVTFDKSNFKDLLILEMVKQMKENWEDNRGIDLFLDSAFNFIESGKNKSDKIIELISQHKSALKTELTPINKINV